MDFLRRGHRLRRDVVLRLNSTRQPEEIQHCHLNAAWMGRFMAKMPRLLLLASFLALFPLAPLQAQTPGNDATDSNATAAAPATSAQAPDEMTKKITELVHAGKYAEAQKLTEGLLIAYPDDQRLIKAKTLIEKLLAPASSPNADSADSLPSQLSAKADVEQLTGVERVEYDSLIELATQAQRDTDLEQQKTSLKQFMDRSSPFLQKHPNEILLWQIRAASAISLDDPSAGYEAGQRLLAQDAAVGSDAKLRQLLTQLNLRGWLDKERHLAIEREKQESTWTDPATGNIWTRQDSGSDVGWDEAKDYCGNLRLAGFTTWQLPTTKELGAINDQVMKGGIKLSGRAPLAWGIPFSGEPCFFIFDQQGGQHCANAINRRFVRALCVRRPVR